MRRLRSEHNLLIALRPAARRHGRRSGVSLIEVLFSLGIVTVGLLGVMIIVPLAGLRTAQGTIADGADRMGRNAIRAFDVYQMRRPDSWAQVNTGSAPASPTFATYPNPWVYPFNPGEAFCIDPLYIAAHAGASGTFDIVRFPYYSTTPPPTTIPPTMRRVTLRSVPGGTINPPPTPPPPIIVPGMSVAQASQLFLGDDDLTFNLPKDRTIPPQQKFNFGGASGVEGLKRQWEGRFSWLATLVPKPGYSSDTFMLSIVVFHRRDYAAVDAERVVDVTAFNSNGFNGGDVVLHVDGLDREDDLKMREGEWLMLAGMNASLQTHFRWYRIQSTDAGPVLDSSGTGYDRDLTLFGQDWPYSAMNVHKAVWIPGVVAVYEKTIRLETSSLWTDL